MTFRLPNPMSAVVWLAFLFPFSLFDPRADRFFGAAVFVLGCVVLFAKPSPWEARKPSAEALRFFLLLEFLYAASAAYSAGFNGAQIASAGGFELLRGVVLGGFAIYVIRHFDEAVRGALDWAAAVSLYASLLFPAADPRGFAAVLTLCWLLFFSRLRLRFLHAATALLVVFFSEDRSAWAAAFLVLAVGASVLVFRELVRRRARLARRWSLLFCVVLIAGPAILLRASRAAAPAPLSTTEAVALQLIRRSPVFGWGPVDGAAILGRNQYLFWLLKEGALGTGLILAGLLLFAFRLLRGAKQESVRLAGTAAFLGSAALMLTAGRFLESFRLFFIAAFFTAGMSGESS